MKKNDCYRYNLRVYGIYIKDANLLVTDEIRFGKKMTKFPGGGMKKGEGTIETLIRECQEEMQLTPDNIEHFYTTDFYQETELLPDIQQLISIYYTMNLPGIEGLKLMNKAFDFPFGEGAQGFRFVPLSRLSPEEFTFPIDRHVAKMIISQYTNKL